ncbi:MAG: hypothetical protein ABIL50_08260 [candidate division WOR-3 bacterium]
MERVKGREYGDLGVELLELKKEEDKVILKFNNQEIEITDKEFIEAIQKPPPDEDDEKQQTQKSKYLGLHLDENNKLKAHWFVGLLKLNGKINGNDEEVIFLIEPKINLSFSRMFLEVMKNPYAGAHFKRGEDWDIITGEIIRLEEDFSDFMIFVILYYMDTLYKLLHRGLQRGYKKHMENLRGRIRGRVLVGATAVENWPRGKKHYAYCEYNEWTEDILENRILKAAFLKGIGFLKRHNIELGEKIRYISLSFEMVSTTRIYPQDFRITNVQRIRRDYKEALKVAEIILRHLGYDPEVETQEKKINTVMPHWINMNELFERYVEVKIRNEEIFKDFKDYDVYPGYKDRNIKTEDEVGKLRPDFVLVKKDRSEYIIADAKYKDVYNTKWDKEDLAQLSLYGRIKVEEIEKWIKEKFHENVEIKNRDKEPKVYIIYPLTENDKGCEEEKAKSFRGIYKICVKVQTKNS